LKRCAALFVAVAKKFHIRRNASYYDVRLIILTVAFSIALCISNTLAAGPYHQASDCDILAYGSPMWNFGSLNWQIYRGIPRDKNS
jgi:hypothetical protein